MSDLLLEFYSEEMPASFLEASANNIKNLLKNRFLKENINFEKDSCFFTPKRIAITFYGLHLELGKSDELIKGPSFNSPEKAVVGFARSFNTVKEKLILKETEKGKYYFFKNKNKPNILNLLTSILETELKRITWKKSMKWGNNKLKWARPLKNILCIFNNRKLIFQLEHLHSSDATVKENLIVEKKYKVKSIVHYLDLMRDFNVMINQQERQRKIINDSKAAIKNKKLTIHSDEKLLKEVCNLVEKPYVFLAQFKDDYLKLPQEILITTMKKNQKYFPLYNDKNKLSNYFLLISNINPPDLGAMIIEGNQRVVNARLEDAAFFWKRDIGKNFQDFYKKLDKLIFHSELGTIQDKVTRLKKLAKQISKSLKLNKIEEKDFFLIVDLFKNDLVTETVKEFPELQGVMGSYYASIAKYNSNISKAIYDQYKPLGPSDKLPRTNLGKLVSLIDKVDTLVGFFIIGKKPSSSKDPFALRRTALGIIRIIVEGRLDISLSDIIFRSLDTFKDYSFSKKLMNTKYCDIFSNQILYFILERYENLVKENKSYKDNLFKGLKVNLLKVNLLKLDENLIYLNSFLGSQDGLKLLNAIKRVINIIDIEKYDNKNILIKPNESLFNKSEETELFNMVNKYASKDLSNYKVLMQNLMFLIDPIENFFDNVKINHQDTQLKKNRLELLFYVNNKINKNVDFINLIKRN